MNLKFISINCIQLTMDKLLEILLTGAGGFLINLFLPKQYASTIRELVKSILHEMVKKWYVSLPILITPIVFVWNTPSRFLFVILITLGVFIFFGVFKFFQNTRRKFSGINIAIYGCFNTTKNSLIMDLDSQSLTEKIHAISEQIAASIFPFKKAQLQAYNISFSKFIPGLLGLGGVNKLIKKRVVENQHIASIHFIKNINEQNISVVINCNTEVLGNTLPLQKVEKVLNSICEDDDISITRISEISVRLFYMLFGQIFMDLLINNKEFAAANYTLDDNYKILQEIKELASPLLPEKRESLLRYLNYWESNLQRYRAIVLLEQKQYRGAINYIGKAIKLNPYYPYDTYLAVKQDYSKKYGMGLSPQLSLIATELDPTYDNTKNAEIINELRDQVDFVDTAFHYDILKQILKEDESEELAAYIENELNSWDKTEPFTLLAICEVLKFCKKGHVMVDEIYLDRIDECLQLLNSVLEIDKDFPLIHAKRGALLLMKGVTIKSDELVKESTIEFQKGIHYLTEIGFDLSDDEDNHSS